MNLTTSGDPGTKIDFLRAWNIGYELADDFQGDLLNRAIPTLDRLSVYDPHEDYGHRYHPMTRQDMADAVRAYIRETPLFCGKVYRVYARYSKLHSGIMPIYRFTHLEFIDADALTGPSGPAVRLGEVTT